MAHKKIRLLIIINRFVIGGQAADTIPLLFELKDRYQVKILYGEKEADEIEPLFLLQQYPGLEIEKIATLKRSINPLNDLLTLIKLHRFIKIYKPHIVHTHGAKSGLLGRFAAWLWGRSIIIHTFHGHLFHSYFNSATTKFFIFLEKMLGRITHAAIALSPSQKNELVEQFKILPGKKIFEIPLGMVEPLTSYVPTENLKEKYKIPSSTLLVAIIGRIVPIKNHIDFLNIAIDVLERGTKNACFLIIGDGNDRNMLENFLANKGFSYSTVEDVKHGSQFIFTSWLTDMYRVITELDIVVLTSSNEGTPVSLIEAQMCAKPVVAYNVGGVKDTFDDGESGFLIEKGDLEQFADRIIELLEDESLRKKMGDRGNEFVCKKFSKKAEVVAIENLYTHLLSGYPTK